MFPTQDTAVTPGKMERRKRGGWDFFPLLRSAEDVEGNGHRMFADATPIERILAGARSERLGKRDPVLSTIAILYQRPNLTVRLPSEGHDHAAISEAANGFLETINRYIMDRREDK